MDKESVNYLTNSSGLNTSVSCVHKQVSTNDTFSPLNCSDVGNGTIQMSNSSEPMLESMPEAYAVPILFGLIFVVGIVGNGTLIFIVARNKAMRNVPNIYIVSLALGDLLLILVSVPFTATIYTFREWPYGEGMCKVNEFLQSLSLGVSVFTLTALSADRYFAIVDPMGKHTRAGGALAMTLVIVAGIWCLSLLLAVPEAVSAHIKFEKHDNHMLALCSLLPPTWGSWYPKFRTCARFLVYFALPMLVIFVFYLLMALVLFRSSRHMLVEGQGQNKQKKQIEARKKVAVVVLGFVLVFIACWLPRHVYMLWFYFDPSNYNMFWHVFKILGFCLSFINSCVNPVALYLLSKQFRKYFDRYLFCLCVPLCRKRSPRQVPRDASSVYQFKPSMGRTATTMTMLQSQTICENEQVGPSCKLVGTTSNTSSSDV